MSRAKNKNDASVASHSSTVTILLSRISRVQVSDTTGDEQKF